MRPKTIYLLYDSRSGSTLLAKMLVEKFKLVSPPETNFLYHLFCSKWQYHNRISVQRILRKDKKFSDLSLSGQLFLRRIGYWPVHRNQIANLFCSLLRKEAGANLMIKKGTNAFVAKSLADSTPNFYFLCIVRDGRAVYNSKRKSLHSETGLPMVSSLDEAAKKWMKFGRIFCEIAELYPDRTMIIRYEDLVNKPDVTVHDIGTFLELRSSGGRSDYYIPEKYDQIHQNVSAAPDPKIADAWKEKLTSEEIATYNRLAAPMLQKFDYPL